MKPTSILKSYLLFSVIYLFLPAIGFASFSWYLKPLLLPFLIFAVLVSGDFRTKNILLFALTFSWIGDIVLMFADKGEIYFIIGLLSFLIAHIAYILLFIRQEKNNTPTKSNNIILGSILLLAYYVGLIFLLFPKLGPLKLPVIIYSLVITSMLFIAFKNSFQWSMPATNYILFGAIAFVLSDSILAINKFYEALPYSNFLIMSTYILAQFGIISGILLLNKK